ncbi:hypothetical protein ACWEQA_12965 [Nocardia sp. NPDC004085]
MNVLNAVLVVVGGTTALVLGKVVVSLLSKEVEGRVDQIGYLILRWARRRLPRDLREMLHDQEWLPEMDDILLRHKDQPITRLFWSLRFSLPLLLWGARRTARIIHPKLPFIIRVRMALSLWLVMVADRFEGTAKRIDGAAELIDQNSGNTVGRDAFGEQLEAAFGGHKPSRGSNGQSMPRGRSA